MNPHIRKPLTQLRLGGLAASLEMRLQEARANNLDHAEFLELLLQDELNVRRQRQIARRTKAATFREARTLDSFDFAFNHSIDRKLIYQLATGEFLAQAQDVLFIGPPGVGKSHLAQAIGSQLIKTGKSVLYRSVFDVVHELLEESAPQHHRRLISRYLKCELLIIDDMGIKQLPAKSGEYLFEIIMRRHQIRSTIMTSNRPLEEWGKLLGDVPAASAILDRFLHHAHIIKISGKSYRLKDRLSK